MKFSEAIVYLEDNPQLYKISTNDLADQGVWYFERHGIIGAWQYSERIKDYQLLKLNIHVNDILYKTWIVDYTNDKETR